MKGHAGSGFLDLAFLSVASNKGTVMFEGTQLYTFMLEMSNQKKWLLGTETSEKCGNWLRSLTAVVGKEKLSVDVSSGTSKEDADEAKRPSDPAAARTSSDNRRKGSGVDDGERARLSLAKNRSGLITGRARGASMMPPDAVFNFEQPDSFSFDAHTVADDNLVLDTSDPLDTADSATTVLFRLASELGCYEPEEAKYQSLMETDDQVRRS